MDFEEENIPYINGQEKIMEVLMPIELIEQIFDSSKRLGYETPEEQELREKREDYNKDIYDKIASVNFTEKQRIVLNYIYFKGFTLAQTAKELGVSITAVQNSKNGALKKARKRIRYHFDHNLND